MEHPTSITRGPWDGDLNSFWREHSAFGMRDAVELDRVDRDLRQIFRRDIDRILSALAAAASTTCKYLI
jgi:hypothetical protein